MRQKHNENSPKPIDGLGSSMSDMLLLGMDVQRQVRVDVGRREPSPGHVAVQGGPATGGAVSRTY